MQSTFQDNSIYFTEVDKIKPNPFQPRREFDPAQLDSLADSIRMYGVLQPLVVTRSEVFADDGGMTTQYELIAGERRLRASKLAGLREVPVIIRSNEQTDREKLEVAIIENLQREDLNPVDRAIAFRQLVDEFGLKHAEVAKKVGKSREYVSNTMRILALPEEMLQAITDKKMTEGHARTLLMLGDRPEEQMVLFKEILLKKLTVRAAEKIARRVAFDKVRKKERTIDPHTVEVEEEMSETLGTRVHIERKAVGGKIEIDFFSEEDLAHILKMLKEKDLEGGPKSVDEKMNNFVEQSGGLAAATNLVFEKEKEDDPEPTTVEEELTKTTPYSYTPQAQAEEEKKPEPVAEEQKEEVIEESQEVVVEEVVESPEEPVVEESSQYAEPVAEVEEEVVDVNKMSEEVIENTPEVIEEEVAPVVEEIKEEVIETQEAPVVETPEEPKEEVVDVNKFSDEVIANTPKLDEETPIEEPVVATEEEVPVEEEVTPEQSPERSKYLEPIEESDLLPNTPDIKTAVTLDDSSADVDENLTFTPKSTDESHIIKDREETGFTEPNVITDFVEMQKEKEEDIVSTPNYGNEEDDLYSVKGM